MAPGLFSSTQNVWYSYHADHDTTLLGHSWRQFSGSDFNVYRSSGSTLIPEYCATDHDDGTDYNHDDVRGLFEVRAGDNYMIEVIGGFIAEVFSSFSLEEAPRIDVTTSDLEVKTTSNPYVNRIAEITVAGAGSIVDIKARMCPATDYPGATCATIWTDRVETCAWCPRLARLSFEWSDRFCAGDMILYVKVTDPFAVDSNLVNNEVSTPVSTPVAGAGTGACAFP